MGVIEYTIEKGAAPFMVELYPNVVPINIHESIGTYQFLDVPDGNYDFIATDSNGCMYEEQLIIDPYTTTTTTIQQLGDFMVIGNTQEPELIFNVDGTNRDSHYSGYPDENISTLYLWLKTFDGKPITAQKIINYIFTGDILTTFTFSELSDEIHAEVIESIGDASIISGQLILKSGFIETYFKYDYNKNPLMQDFKIELNSNTNWIYNNIPLTGGTNQYGVTYVDNDNIIMNF